MSLTSHEALHPVVSPGKQTPPQKGLTGSLTLFMSCHDFIIDTATGKAALYTQAITSLSEKGTLI
jgi:hypothetical protein